MCLEYKNSDAKTKKTYLKELLIRGQINKSQVPSISNTQIKIGFSKCAMYMALGIPKEEKGTYIRPMVYEVVHTYENMIVRSRSGIVSEIKLHS